MNEKLAAIVGLTVVFASLVTAYFTLPPDQFTSMLIATFGFSVMLIYPWALLYVMVKLEEEGQEERFSSRLQSCVRPN
jgi:phenylacetate-coenzyme A ligase PaaK-like adenylate-forming protein